MDDVNELPGRSTRPSVPLSGSRYPRLQLFEFNDSEWCPPSLRDTIVEALSRSLEWSGVIRGLVPVLDRFVRECGMRDILELCAGAGQPAAVLCRALGDHVDPPVRIVLTDLFPRVESWETVRRTNPARLTYISEPVNATAIPQAVGTGRARMMLNAFHHFPPRLASAILRDAVRSGAPILIAEAFERDPRGLLPIFTVGGAALLAGPVLSPKQRTLKALWTWLTPVAALSSVWDGLVSTLRVYTEDNLRAMVAPFGAGYRWSYGTYPTGLGRRGVYFYGIAGRRRGRGMF
jgi:hypothetical protein